MTISNRDDMVTSRLLTQAAVHGRPVEDEAGQILRASLTREPPAAMRARFAPLGGVELPTITRDPMRERAMITSSPPATSRTSAPNPFPASDIETITAATPTAATIRLGPNPEPK
jgi:plasmid stability protein